jgi:hypothetical protein
MSFGGCGGVDVAAVVVGSDGGGGGVAAAVGGIIDEVEGLHPSLRAENVFTYNFKDQNADPVECHTQACDRIRNSDVYLV